MRILSPKWSNCLKKKKSSYGKLLRDATIVTQFLPPCRDLMTRPDLWPTKQVSSCCCTLPSSVHNRKWVISFWLVMNHVHKCFVCYNIWAGERRGLLVCIVKHKKKTHQSLHHWPSAAISAPRSRGMMGGEVWMPDLYHKRSTRRKTALWDIWERKIK